MKTSWAYLVCVCVCNQWNDLIRLKKYLTSESEAVIFRFLFGADVATICCPSLSDSVSEANGFLESNAFFFWDTFLSLFTAFFFELPLIFSLVARDIGGVESSSSTQKGLFVDWALKTELKCNKYFCYTFLTTWNNKHVSNIE